MNHLGSLVMKTEHLYLRPFVLEDAPGMYENWASDPENLKYVTWDAHTSPERTRESIKRWVEQYQKPDTYKWAICFKTSPDQVIGDISVVSQDQESQSCELGYILGKKFWGKGFMTEAVIAVLDFLLNEVGIKEIKATYVSLNPASGKVMAKAGMQYVETIPHAIQRKGYCGDKIIYSIQNPSL